MFGALSQDLEAGPKHSKRITHVLDAQLYREERTIFSCLLPAVTDMILIAVQTEPSTALSDVFKAPYDSVFSSSLERCVCVVVVVPSWSCCYTAVPGIALFIHVLLYEVCDCFNLYFRDTKHTTGTLLYCTGTHLHRPAHG